MMMMKIYNKNPELSVADGGDEDFIVQKAQIVKPKGHWYS